MDLGLDGRRRWWRRRAGLGRAVATALAAEGARVMVSGRDKASLANTAGEIREAPTPKWSITQPT